MPQLQLCDCKQCVMVMDGGLQQCKRYEVTSVSVYGDVAAINGARRTGSALCDANPSHWFPDDIAVYCTKA